MTLPISRELLLKELETARDFLNKWHARVEEGIPGVDIPATGNAEEYTEAFFVEMCGELRLISSKCETLSEILATIQIG